MYMYIWHFKIKRMADINIDLDCSDPVQLLGQGIRAFTMRNYNAAVGALSKASEVAVQKYGDDKHDSLGNIYLFYGKALLELSREEAEPLGDAVPRIINESDDSDENDEGNGNGTEDDNEKSDTNDVANKVTSTEKENIKMIIDKNLPFKKENEDEELEKSDKVKQITVGGDDSEGEKVNGQAEQVKLLETVPGGSKENGDKVDEIDEDPSDLQVAWEVLELAKIIFEKRGEVGKKDLAETLITLGEISLESENFESAIGDIKQGLGIQKNIYQSDSRQLAETHYKLGMAFSTNNQIDDAIENFNLSLIILNNKVEKLKVAGDTTANANEIEEIQSLIPEIEEKIADMKNFKEEAVKKISASIEQQSNIFEESSSEIKPNDISHLVKRKRKLEDITEELEANPAKKQSQEKESTNE